MSKRFFLFFTISTFILTVLWVASNVYHSYATSTIDPLLTSQIEEIPSSFDIEVITELKIREVIEPNTSSIPTLESEEQNVIEDTSIDEAEQNQAETPQPTDIEISPETPTPTEQTTSDTNIQTEEQI